MAGLRIPMLEWRHRSRLCPPAQPSAWLSTPVAVLESGPLRVFSLQRRLRYTGSNRHRTRDRYSLDRSGPYGPPGEPVDTWPRETYQGKITYVVRYFPIAAHPNAQNAALAAEAAAVQGQFEAMYHKLFQGQAEWGHRRESPRATFVRYATELGLDVPKFEQAMDDPATAERIARDQADGATAGVSGTPTFFLNGQRLQPRSTQDLIDAVDNALAD